MLFEVRISKASLKKLQFICDRPNTISNQESKHDRLKQKAQVQQEDFEAFRHLNTPLPAWVKHSITTLLIGLSPLNGQDLTCTHAR